jgi:hypothetical protein
MGVAVCMGTWPMGTKMVMRNVFWHSIAQQVTRVNNVLHISITKREDFKGSYYKEMINI